MPTLTPGLSGCHQGDFEMKRRKTPAHSTMDKRLLERYLVRRIEAQHEIIDHVPVFSKRYGDAVDELEEVEDLLARVGTL